MQWEQFRCNIDCENHPKDCISENLFVDMIDRLSDVRNGADREA